MKGKKVLSAILMVIFIMTLKPMPAFATASEVNKLPKLNEANLVLDTSNPEIGLAFFIDEKVMLRGSYQTTERTGSGYFYLKSNGDVLSNFNCTGYFSYDKVICNVTDIDTSVWATINGWRVEVNESTKQISPTYACATGLFKLYKVGLFGDSLSSSATINVYCNQNGSTSVEFNSD